MENKKKNAEQKIVQMKENALKDIKNISVKVSMEAVEHLVKNSIDKKKLDKISKNYTWQSFCKSMIIYVEGVNQRQQN